VTLNPHSHPQRSEVIRWQAVEEEGILVNLDSGFYFSLNPVGLFIWQLCDGEHSAKAILDGVVDAFDVDGDTAVRDLESFMTQLEAEGLLEIPDTEAG